MADKKPKKQDSTALSKTLEGQLSKSQKRDLIFRDIRANRAKTHAAIKQVRQAIRMAKNV
jgi:hypothetical protein